MICVENEEQRRILRKFQKRLKDLNQDERTCLRFLKARDFDLDKGEDMIRKNVLWRREIDLETILHDYKIPDYIKESMPYGFTGTSHNGGPVIWVQSGRWDWRYWLNQGKDELEILTFTIYVLECCLKRIEKAEGKQLVVILDYEGLTFLKATHLQSLRLLYNFFVVMERNYPEILQDVVIIKVPKVFHTAYAFVKQAISVGTINKIQMFGSDINEFLPAIRKLIPEKSFLEGYLNL